MNTAIFGGEAEQRGVAVDATARGTAKRRETCTEVALQRFHILDVKRFLNMLPSGNPVAFDREGPRHSFSDQHKANTIRRQKQKMASGKPEAIFAGDSAGKGNR